MELEALRHQEEARQREKAQKEDVCMWDDEFQLCIAGVQTMATFGILLPDPPSNLQPSPQEYIPYICTNISVLINIIK